MKTFLAICLLIGASASGAFWWLNNQPEPLPKFRSLSPSRGELLIAVSATGTVEPVEVVDVGAQIVGRVKEFGPDRSEEGKTIDFGSKVKAGDILSQIDDSTYLAERDKAQANLRLAKADLKRSQAQQTHAQGDFKRAESLRDTNAESDFDRALAAAEMAKAEVLVSEARVEQAELALKQAEINLGYTRISAPIDGVVIDRKVNVGQTVVAGLNAPSLFLLARDLDRMQVWAAVNEADIGEIHLGQSVSFKVDAHRDRTFAGTVTQIRLNAGMSNNVVAYGVIVAIDNHDGALKPYMTANLQFEVARRSDALLIPNQALRWRPTLNQISPEFRDEYRVTTSATAALDGSGAGELPLVDTKTPTVWVVSHDGLAKPIAVTTGLTDGMSTEVTGGDLTEDDRLIVGRARKSKRDFVSSFVSRVTGKAKEE